MIMMDPSSARLSPGVLVWGLILYLVQCLLECSELIAYSVTLEGWEGKGGQIGFCVSWCSSLSELRPCCCSFGHWWMC